MAVDDIDATALMPLETPLLKVSRPVAACSRCRNAKIKCDGKLPACTSCEKNGRAAECTSTNDQFARGKERSYVSTLETRIDKLRAKLDEARARKPSVVSIPDDETALPSRRQSYNAQELPSAGSSKAQRRKEASAIDDLVSDFGFLSVNATARDFYGFTSAMSYARLVISACSKDPLPGGTTKELPARYTATGHIQHYLNNIFVLLPVFDEASFYASVDSVYAKETPTRKADPFDHWTVRMVLAIANASMSEQRGDQPYLEGIGHVCAALEHAEAVLQPGAISSVQALVLLTQYAMLDPHHLDSWSLIGAASRAMVDIGLHQDPPKGTPMSKGKLELRRRVFWCVYALDRSTSLVQTRAFSFSDNSTKVKVPFSKAPAVLPNVANSQGLQKAWLQSHETALDLINLRQLQSDWYTDLFQSGRLRWEEPYHYLWQACDDTRKWFESLSATTNPNMRAFFELDLLYSYIYVLSPSPRIPAISPFAAKLIFEYCIRYAELILRLVSDSSYTAPLTFYDAMRVYMTGRQFLDVLQHNTDPLLNGYMPPHPEVKPTAAPPPVMPVVHLPPGDTLQHFNTVRSIHCIKQITECLSKFGIRWGYMSWNQRYQNETTTMLENLNQRLRELDEMSGRRRPSMWQHTSSTGSVHSNGGSSYHSNNGSSVAYPSPQSLPPGYRHSSVTAYNMGFGEPGQLPHASPPPYQHQQSPFRQSPGLPFDQAQQLFQQPGGQSFSFGEQLPVQQHQYPANPHGNPHHQFGNWGGYAAGPSMPDTLDEETAAYVRQLHQQYPWLSEDEDEVQYEASPTAPVVPLFPSQHWSVLQALETNLQRRSSGESSNDSEGSGRRSSRPHRHSRPSGSVINIMQERHQERLQQLPGGGDDSSPERVRSNPAQNRPPRPPQQGIPLHPDQLNPMQAQELAALQGRLQQETGSGSASDSEGLTVAPNRPDPAMGTPSNLGPPHIAQTRQISALQSDSQQQYSTDSSSGAEGIMMAPARAIHGGPPLAPRNLNLLQTQQRRTSQQPAKGSSGEESSGSEGLMMPPTRGRPTTREQHAVAFTGHGISRASSLGSLHIQTDLPENQSPGSPQHRTGSFTFSVPSNSSLPPLTGRNPASSVPPQRRSSMHDYITDLLGTPPPPLVGLWQPPQHERPPSPRTFSPVKRHRRNPGKQLVRNSISRFAGDDGYFHNVEGEEAYPDHPGFMTLPGVGYSCNVCTLVVQQPLHHSTNGAFCFDATWDPIMQQPVPGLPPVAAPPAGVDPGLARQQNLAGRIVSKDFAPYVPLAPAPAPVFFSPFGDSTIGLAGFGL